MTRDLTPAITACSSTLSVTPTPTPTPNQGQGPYPSQHSLFLYACTDEKGRVLGPASDVFSLGALL